MAIVDDKYIIEIERQRAELVGLLQSKGVLIDSDTDLATAITMVDKIGQNDLLYDFIQGNLTEIALLDENVTTLESDNPFAPIAPTVTKINMPYIEAIRAFFYSGATSAFSGAQVQHINIPSLKRTGNRYGLGYMPRLINIVAPDLIVNHSDDYGLISGDTALLRFIAPQLATVTNARISTGLGNLTIIDATRITTGGSYPSLKTLILRSKVNISTLTNSSNIPSDTEIYVPQSMIETYQNGTNWSAVERNYIALEGSKYEPTDWYKTEDWYLEEMAVWQ